VAGGAGGIGTVQVRAALRHGAAFVVIADVLDTEGSALADELGERAAFVHLDVTLEADWRAAFAEVRRLASRPADVLLFTAGIIIARPIERLTATEFARVVEVCLTGAFLGIQSAIPHMREAGGGSIVLISSVDGFAGVPTFAAYTSAKHGMLGLMRVAAIELGSVGIRVNAIAPGAIDTPMTRGTDDDGAGLDVFARQIPLGRVGQPQDIADASVFLASSDADFITGSVLTVDGGTMGCVPLSLDGWEVPPQRDKESSTQATNG
jgi:3alpha(or 20beta)-hydroxysteroid dehydrogenase